MENLEYLKNLSCVLQESLTNIQRLVELNEQSLNEKEQEKTIYDMHFVVPCSLKGKYKKRIIDFLQCYGIFNIKNRKIKISLLIGKDAPDPQIIEGLKADIEFVKCFSDEVVTKLYDFLSQLSVQDVKNTKWIAKIDDDSYNNIDKMVETLEKYNYKDKYYIMPGPEIKEDIHPVEKEFINAFGISHLYPNIYHELEASWTSQGAMCEILMHATANKLIQTRKHISQGHTDQCLAIAAQLVGSNLKKEKHFQAANDIKIALTNEIFVEDPQDEEEYIIEPKNKIYHIHPICEDKNQLYFNIVKNALNNTVGEHEEFMTKNKFLFQTHKEKESLEFISNGQFDYKTYPKFMQWGIVEEEGKKELWISTRTIKFFKLPFDDLLNTGISKNKDVVLQKL